MYFFTVKTKEKGLDHHIRDGNIVTVILFCFVLCRNHPLMSCLFLGVCCSLWFVLCLASCIVQSLYSVSIKINSLLIFYYIR